MHKYDVKRFTEKEAKEKLHYQVRSLVEFAGVPPGTTGRVVNIFNLEGDLFDIVVRWDLPHRDKPLLDRFAKSTYEELLDEQQEEVLV